MYPKARKTSNVSRCESIVSYVNELMYETWLFKFVYMGVKLDLSLLQLGDSIILSWVWGSY
jgi:hypothetical protein